MHEHEIMAHLKKLQQLAAPDQAVLRAKNMVMATVRRNLASRLVVAERSPFIKRLIPGYQFKYMPILAIILAVVLGGGGTVAAAQNDLPGDALYRVKLASERVAEKFAGGDEARLNFEAKLAERRAAEIAGLKEAAGRAGDDAETAADAEVTAKADQRFEAHASKTADRLERRIEKMTERVEALKEKNTEGTLEAAAQLEARMAIMKEVLAVVESAETKAELKEKLAEVRGKAEELRQEAEEIKDEVLKHRASAQGLERSARGRVKAVENKLEALTRNRERLLERAQKEPERFFKEEFEARDQFYQEAVALLAEAKAALQAKQWETAWEKANAAFKAMVRVQGPHLTPHLLKQIRPEDVTIDERVETAKPMTDEERKSARLTEQEKAEIRASAAAGAEAKRQEVLEELLELRGALRGESKVVAPAPKATLEQAQVETEAKVAD